MTYFYVDGKRVKAEKINPSPAVNKNDAQDHVLNEMNVGPVKKFFYKKILQCIDDFIEDKRK